MKVRQQFSQFLKNEGVRPTKPGFVDTKQLIDGEKEVADIFQQASKAADLTLAGKLPTEEPEDVSDSPGARLAAHLVQSGQVEIADKMEPSIMPAVIPVGYREDPATEGIFAVDLHQLDFRHASEKPIYENKLATLYVDTTPGESGLNYLIAR